MQDKLTPNNLAAFKKKDLFKCYKKSRLSSKFECQISFEF